DIEDVKDFPTEIKNAIESGPQENSNKWAGDYYIVGNKGFAITFDMSVIKKGGVAVSPFASMLLDSLEIDKAKSNVDIKDDMYAVKCEHCKDRRDEHSIYMKATEEATEWSRIIRRALPISVATPVTPFDLQNMNISGTVTSSANITERASPK